MITLKNFFKSALIVLLIGIVIASIAGSRNINSSNSTLTSIIDRFEDEVANGSVIKDGVIEGATSIEDEIVVSGNTLASLFNKLGSLLVDGIGKMLKLVAELITKFIG